VTDPADREADEVGADEVGADGGPGDADEDRPGSGESWRERRRTPPGPTAPGERPGPPRDAAGYRAAPSPVALGTSSVFPDTVAGSFDIAQELGYDGMEVIVTVDPASQDTAAIERVASRHALTVESVHAPTLLLTQTVWSLDPWEKLRRSAEMAQVLGAPVVVVHPPFRWQKEYASRFGEGIAELGDAFGVTFAVENLYPWRVAGRTIQAYEPSHDPTGSAYPALTLDVSHASAAGSDCLAMARAMGDRLAHVHLTDGSGGTRDEHLLPGRGTQPVAELLRHLAAEEFAGAVVLEVSTTRAPDRAARVAWLAEALAFAREHLVAPVTAGWTVTRDGVATVCGGADRLSGTASRRSASRRSVGAGDDVRNGPTPTPTT